MVKNLIAGVAIFACGYTFAVLQGEQKVFDDYKAINSAFATKQMYKNMLKEVYKDSIYWMDVVIETDEYLWYYEDLKRDSFFEYAKKY